MKFCGSYKEENDPEGCAKIKCSGDLSHTCLQLATYLLHSTLLMSPSQLHASFSPSTSPETLLNSFHTAPISLRRPVRLLGPQRAITWAFPRMLTLLQSKLCKHSASPSLKLCLLSDSIHIPLYTYYLFSPEWASKEVLKWAGRDGEVSSFSYSALTLP